MRINTPQRWYAFDAKYSLELLQHYCGRIELQIASGILHFDDNKERHPITDGQLDTGQDIDIYEGLESMTWDLKDIHYVHFPNLQRKSAFLTMYTFLECELEKLARKFKRELSLAGDLEDIEGKGIYRSLMYLRLIANLPIEKGDKQWSKISQLNKLRNLIVHNDGRLEDHQGNRKPEAKVIKQMIPHVDEKQGELILNVSFLPYALGKFSELFKHLDKCIQAKFEKRP